MRRDRGTGSEASRPWTAGPGTEERLIYRIAKVAGHALSERHDVFSVPLLFELGAVVYVDADVANMAVFVGSYRPRWSCRRRRVWRGEEEKNRGDVSVER